MNDKTRQFQELHGDMAEDPAPRRYIPATMTEPGYYEGEDEGPSIEDRRNTAFSTLCHYVTDKGDESTFAGLGRSDADTEDAIVDLMADLLHLAKGYGFTPFTLLQRATTHFEAESK